MRKSALELAESIKRLQVDSNLNTIWKTMRELDISIGQLVEYSSTKGSLEKTTAERLREINQTRKKARERLAQQKSNLEKAQKTRQENRAKLLENAKKAQEQNATPDLNIDVDLSNIDLDNIGAGVDAVMDLNIDASD